MHCRKWEGGLNYLVAKFVHRPMGLNEYVNPLECSDKQSTGGVERKQCLFQDTKRGGT